MLPKSNFAKGALIVVASAVTSEIVYWVYLLFWDKAWKKYGTKKQTQCDNVVTEVIFFPDDKIACKAHFASEDGCENKMCRFTHEANSLSRLYGYLTSAKTSLDVSVFVITCTDLADLLIEAHKRGVLVRVITDDEQVDITGSQIWKLRSAGINVRTDQSSYNMHHKFVVVDKMFLLNGSFNWTRQAITGNQENLMIINSSKIVSLYLGEFEKLWQNFDPKNRNGTSFQKRNF
ncbi:hypothetical protein CHS0354_028640 [Potamilus streckersoni]|uniref:Mitochondrial cardiolipin hydrolase n=1 Tax=Potamilus streckersoni TaxID=2493646 RepID=A0AAE0SWX1_9BIVA|nr:hypothetical protein CHS0354_028640 [Potamilus streckersoni]